MLPKLDENLSHWGLTRSADGATIQDADIARLSPLGNAHLNVLGRESFTRAEPVLRGAWRPFRQPDQDD